MGAPSAYCPRVLLLGKIPQNTHRNKKGVVCETLSNLLEGICYSSKCVHARHILKS
jgi:hypothetical protein